ncbi:hypothetical protein [Winogradskyella wandonensis]|uniref:hypothetical protein n=1 Tax=Winogradskyella wandonensis TaxID=1442586 RepID=UPI0010454D9C|nr:hypothetical protein [Winogradskyella wandonensis]
MKKRHEQKLIINSIAVFIILNIPLIFIFNSDKSVFGVPIFYFAVFCVWAISILISYVVLKRHYE